MAPPLKTTRKYIPLKRRPLIISLVALAAMLVIWAPWRWSLRYHFGFTLPPTGVLVHYHHSLGRDYSDEFEFDVTDDALRDAIIKEWKLKPASPDRDVMTFASLGPVPWWPGARLKMISER